jgi:hypothetical protein
VIFIAFLLILLILLLVEVKDKLFEPLIAQAAVLCGGDAT